MMVDEIDDEDEGARQAACHHCYGWSANDRCLGCGKDMKIDPEQEEKYRYVLGC